jgi:hypothetical protein
MAMISVREHLTSLERDYAGRALLPRIAWDAVAAGAWSRFCAKLVRDIASMEEAGAVEYMRAMRDCPSALGAGGWSLLLELDFAGQMSKIVDPIAMELTGCIHAGASRRCPDIPEYSRVLNDGHIVDSCIRGPDENDFAWLARRAHWLGRYHPAVWVVGGKLDQIGVCACLVARVGRFIEFPQLRADELRVV